MSNSLYISPPTDFYQAYTLEHLDRILYQTYKDGWLMYSFQRDPWFYLHGLDPRVKAEGNRGKLCE